MGFFQKIKAGLSKTRNSMMSQVDDAFDSKKVDEELFEELEEILILSDVGIDTSTEICDRLRKKVKEDKIKDAFKAKEAFKQILIEMLDCEEPIKLNTKPAVILVVGVNGVGKTTTIGKLANNFKQEGKSVLLAAADTFRAAAIDQLEIWAERCGCRMVRHNEGADPAAVVYDAMASAKKRGYDIVICDTAGRLHNKKNLMQELEKITKVIRREGENCDIEVLLVVDASTGQNGVRQAEEFKQTAGVTGIILTKLDGTAKGGVVAAIRHKLQLPIRYVGVGEQLDDLQPFDAEEFVNALFEETE